MAGLVGRLWGRGAAPGSAGTGHEPVARLGQVAPRGDATSVEGPGGGASPRTLVVTDDIDLLDDVLRLAAAAGVEVEVAATVAAARRAWLHAPLVVVCDDLAAALAATRPPRRRDVVLCAGPGHDVEVWRRAFDLGAEHVVAVPDDEPWLADRLADAVAGPSREARVVAVVGGRGGAGASTVAVGVATAGRRRGMRTLLVDADPLGGGLDLLLGAENDPGLRWPDLAVAAGRVAPAALEEALPRSDSLAVLSWDRGDLLEVPGAAMRAVLDAGERGFDLVVVDLPRRPDDAAREALARATVTFLLVPREVRAVAAASRVAAVVGALTADLRLVTRGPAPGGLAAADVAEALGLPLVADLRADRSLPAETDLGAPPGRRGPLAAACERLVDLAASRDAA